MVKGSTEKFDRNLCSRNVGIATNENGMFQLLVKFSRCLNLSSSQA